MSLEKHASDLALASSAFEQEISSPSQHIDGYRRPAQPILDALHAAVTPIVLFSPTREYMLTLDCVPYLTIEDLAQPKIPWRVFD
jgi:hypothetical protein